MQLNVSVPRVRGRPHITDRGEGSPQMITDYIGGMVKWLQYSIGAKRLQYSMEGRGGNESKKTIVAGDLHSLHSVGPNSMERKVPPKQWQYFICWLCMLSQCEAFLNAILGGFHFHLINKRTVIVLDLNHWKIIYFFLQVEVANCLFKDSW